MDHDCPVDISDGPCGECENEKELSIPQETLIKRLVWLLEECKRHLTTQALAAEECDGGQTLEEAIDEAIAHTEKK